MAARSQKTEPALRFKDEQGRDYPDWEIKLLGEISNFIKGKGISKSDIVSNGAVECIRYGELYTHYGTTISHVISSTNVSPSQLELSNKNDVIIPSSGETASDIAKAACLILDGVALGGDINIIRCQQNGVFLAYYLNYKKPDIARLAQGISVIHLYASQLRLLKLSIPSIKEQQKIAALLSSVDTKIEQLGKKKALLEQYKKGMMQKLFGQEIRFKDASGSDYPEWGEKTFGDICNVKRGASPRPITSPKWFSDNSNIGWVRISDVTSSNKYLKETAQYLSGEGVRKSRFISKGNIIMSICATIGKPIYTDFDVCIHDGFVVFDGLKVNKEFTYYFLEKVQNRWYRYGQPGTQVNLNSAIVSNEKIKVPAEAEQQKIANFLSAIDRKIELVATQLEQARSFKKGLLQQMFI